MLNAKAHSANGIHIVDFLIWRFPNLPGAVCPINSKAYYNRNNC